MMNNFSFIFNSIRTNGSFPMIAHSIESCVEQLIPEQTNKIIKMILCSPHTRPIPNQKVISHTTIWRTMKKEICILIICKWFKIFNPVTVSSYYIFDNRDNKIKILLNYILFTYEFMFTKNGIQNVKNSHKRSSENPNAIKESNFQPQSSLNIWCGIETS